MPISEKLINPYFKGHLQEVNRLLDSASVKVTKWGERIVTFKKNNEEVSLFRLIKRTWSITDEKSGVTRAQRKSGEAIQGKLRNFYRLSGEALKQENFITRFLAEIRVLFTINIFKLISTGYIRL